LACAVVFSVLFWGCSSGIPPSTYCYQVTTATAHAVDTGMNVAGDLYRAGKISDAAKVKLVAAHDVYRPIAQGVSAACKVVADQVAADAQVLKLQTEADKVTGALVAAGAR
jgi:hypothetical protein